MNRISNIRSGLDEEKTEFDNDADLDSIKSILFGSYAEEFDKRLKALEHTANERYQNQNELLSELSLSAKALDSDKLDREHLAALLAEFASRLSKKC